MPQQKKTGVSVGTYYGKPSNKKPGGAKTKKFVRSKAPKKTWRDYKKQIIIAATAVFLVAAIILTVILLSMPPRVVNDKNFSLFTSNLDKYIKLRGYEPEDLTFERAAYEREIDRALYDLLYNFEEFRDITKESPLKLGDTVLFDIKCYKNGVIDDANLIEKESGTGLKHYLETKVTYEFTAELDAKIISNSERGVLDFTWSTVIPSDYGVEEIRGLSVTYQITLRGRSVVGERIAYRGAAADDSISWGDKVTLSFSEKHKGAFGVYKDVVVAYTPEPVYVISDTEITVSERSLYWDKLVGHDTAKGAVVVFEFDYPGVFPDDMASSGKHARRTVTVESVQKAVFPEINDELATALDFEDAEELLTYIDNAAKTALLYDRVAELSTVKKYPAKVVDGRNEVIWDNIVYSMINNDAYKIYIKNGEYDYQGYLDDYYGGISYKDFKKYIYNEAKEFTREQLIMFSLAQKYKIEYTDEEFRDYIALLCEATGKSEDAIFLENGGEAEMRSSVIIERLYNYIGEHVIIK